ncbi:MAG: hypothetical protein K2I37_01860 [Muribaculaceae bacterium]|nr:hypothetical protein [Muribaculaceae bacterium]
MRGLRKSIFIRGLLLTALLLVCAIGVTSCRDELLMESVPDGSTRVEAEVRFMPLVVANLEGAGTRSGGMVFDGEAGVGAGEGTSAPTGTAMDGVSHLTVLFYDGAGRLSEKREPVEVDLEESAPVLEERENGESTYCVRFKVDVPYGDYKIFAVANMPDLLTEHKDDIRTIDGLRSIRLGGTAGGGNAMLGMFTTDASETRGMNFETDIIASVRPSTTLLHSWMRRSVSKLTIDFDGSALNDNVYIFIKEARLYDVASGCCLGRYSCVGNPPQGSTVTGGFDMAASGHKLVYGAGDDYHAWPVVVKNGTLDSYESGGKRYGLHDEAAYCLPFYENMQGTGAMKYQDTDNDGRVDFPDAGEYETDAEGNRKWLHDEAKDSRPNGTYVEVTGYYRSESLGYVSEGPIRYRFMLGKNIADNYDCERNHHYKLTLGFKGNGNDADWHIEYKDEVGIYLPNPLYISYLYNHQMKLPVRINTGGAKVKKLRVKILSNNWAPDVPDYAQHPFDYYRAVDVNNGFGTKAPYNGFLTLLRVSQTTVNGPGGDGDFTYNKTYYETTVTCADGYTANRGEREYSVEPGDHEDNDYGSYTIKRSRNIIEAVIPLYTRAKQLVPRTGYTGNNPYENYQRRAVVEVTAILDDGKDTEMPGATTEIYQVRRVVNPKGIFRHHNNATPFDVTLMELHGEYSTEFVELESHGSWRAYVIAGDANFINLDGKNMVEGDTKDKVSFRVNFNGTCAATQSRFAIIRVEYHNYNCVHLIFVRQGDAPVSMYSGSPLWHTYNMLTKGSEVAEPVDEGSLFRFGNWDMPIDASQNNYPGKAHWVNISPEDFVKQGPFRIAGRPDLGSVEWDNITSQSSQGSFSDITLNGENVEVAQVADYRKLRENTEQGYGVLYGDAAVKVQKDINKVYGYQRDANGNVDPECGMRGCFVYIGYRQGNVTVPRAEHIFFPIGASGYGRRKEYGVHQFGESELQKGMLRYASGRTNRYYFENGPLFYDLFKRPGAVYWTKFRDSEDDPRYFYLALDINYFTFDFTTLPQGNLFGNKSLEAGNSDACFVRCVTRK